MPECKLDYFLSSSFALKLPPEVIGELPEGIRANFYLAGISDLPALDGPFIHPKAAQRPKLLFVTASSRFRGRQLSPW